ncbi:MAG: DUF433 domain-containing protein [Limisphaerales bacterium]
MNAPDHVGIMADADPLGGVPRIRDTRISVALLLKSLADGLTIADVVDAHPSLTPEAVRGVLQELAGREARAA